MLSINMRLIRPPMNSIRLCMKIFSILVLIVFLAFSGFQCASIGSVAMERGIIGQNPSALDSGNATQALLTENAFSVTSGIYKRNPELGIIPETDGEYNGNREEYLVSDATHGNNNADNRLRRSLNSDAHYDLLAEEEMNDVESTDEENPAESQVLKRMKRRGRGGGSGTPYSWRGCGEYKRNGFIKKGHDSKLARDHTHPGIPCRDYDRTFHWPNYQNPQYVPKGQDTFYMAITYIWGECNDTLDTSKESKQRCSNGMGSTVLDPVNGTDADTVSTTTKPAKKKTHINMCPVAFATASSMQRLGFMAKLIPILMGLLYFGN